MQLPSAGNLHAIQIIGILYTQADICIQFLKQSVTNLSGGNIFPLLPCKGAVIYGEIHCQCGFGNLHKGQRFRLFGGTDGIPNHDIFNAAKRNNIADARFLYLHSLQALKFVQLCDTNLFLCFRIVHIQNDNLVIDAQYAVFNLTDADTAQIFAVVNRRNQSLCRRIHIPLGCRNVVDDCFKQRLHIPFSCISILGRIAASCRCEYKGRIQLVFVCIQLHEQLQNLIHNLIRACFGSIHLIYADNNRVIQLQRLAQNEFCLGHRPFKCIHHQHNAVYHFQHTLYLAAEIGMSGGINDVDFGIAIVYGCVFGKNGNPSFPFNIAAVHDSFLYLLIGTEDTALSEQLIHQCGFAVVNVGNNRYVSDIFNILTHLELLQSFQVFLLHYLLCDT